MEKCRRSCVVPIYFADLTSLFFILRFSSVPGP